MSKKHKPYKSRLPERDIEILEMLFHLQSIRAIDIVSTYFEKSGEYGLKRLQKLCDKGFIERTFTVKSNGQRNNSVYQIADRGIEELLKIGKISQERRARDMRLSGWELLARIDISKIVLKLKQAGWRIIGSRDAKPKLSLPWNSSLQCLAESPAPEKKQYLVYHMGYTIKEPTLIKLQAELESSKGTNLIAYRAGTIMEETPAYLDFVKYYTENGVLSHRNSMQLMPLVEWQDSEGKTQNFVLNALLYGGQPQLEQYLRKQYQRVKYSDNRYYFGNLMAEEDNQEYFICNYLQRDRAALRMLAENLTMQEYQKNKTGAIVITWNGLIKEAQEFIDRYQKRDFIKVKGITVRDIIESAGAGNGCSRAAEEVRA